MYEVPPREPDQIDCAYLKIWFDRVPDATGKGLENRKLSKYYLDSGFSTISEHKYGKFGRSNSVGSQLLVEEFKLDSQIESKSKLLTEMVEVDVDKFGCGLINVDNWEQFATYFRGCFLCNKKLKLEELKIMKLELGIRKVLSDSELDNNTKHFSTFHDVVFLLQYLAEIHLDYKTKIDEKDPVKNVYVIVYGHNARLETYYLEELFSIMYKRALITRAQSRKISVFG